jgi:predicted metal-dependent hydrolase
MAVAIQPLHRSAALLEEGRELYAAGRFFEAHEAWEVAWREEVGARRQLFQGLVQAAAAYHKMVVQRQPVGMAKLLEGALLRLRPFPDGFAGLELERFRLGLSASWEEARRWQAGGPSPSGPAPLGTRGPTDEAW